MAPAYAGWEHNSVFVGGCIVCVGPAAEGGGKSESMTDKAEFKTRSHKPEQEGTSLHANCLECSLAPALRH